MVPAGRGRFTRWQRRHHLAPAAGAGAGAGSGVVLAITSGATAITASAALTVAANYVRLRF